MPDTLKPYSMITDYVTGRAIPNIGAEENRQAVEQFLVNAKGYSKDDIATDVKIEMMVAGKPYSSQVDMVVTVGPAKKRIMAFKCAAGSRMIIRFPWRPFPTVKRPLSWIQSQAKKLVKGWMPFPRRMPSPKIWIPTGLLLCRASGKSGKN